MSELVLAILFERAGKLILARQLTPERRAHRCQ